MAKGVYMKRYYDSGGDKKQGKTDLRKFLKIEEVPKSAYVLLVLLYCVSTLTLSRCARSQEMIELMGVTLPLSVFTGVFSSLGNICLLILTVLYKKTGFITALALIAFQLPMMFVNIFVRHFVASIPGIFANLMTIIALIIIYVNNRRTRKFQERVQAQAVVDALTGLPNRFAFSELIREFVRRRTKFAVVSIDLNNFKSINDTYGNKVGDKVLIKVGQRWKELSESGKTGTRDLVARLGGDEYALIILGYLNEAELLKTVSKYKEELEKVLTVDDFDYYLTASFGYAEYPFDDDSSDTLFNCADAAMHAVKHGNISNGIVKYNPEMMNQEHELEIERKLRYALDNDGIEFNLQPQYDIEHKLRGFEALARLRDTDGQMIPPAVFIPVAEKVGLIDQVDIRVFRKSATFLGNLLKGTGSDITLSVNISVKHLMKKNFLEEIRDIMNSNGMAPENLEIEITESIMIDSKAAFACIEEIKRMGIKVAIDDFGTGYSSLSYLNKLPADLLKIDKSFIDDMNSSESSKQYVASIISIGHIMKLKVISEGVESPDQLDVLKQIGCDYIQGFIWGRPLPAEEVEKLIAGA